MTVVLFGRTRQHQFRWIGCGGRLWCGVVWWRRSSQSSGCNPSHRLNLLHATQLVRVNSRFHPHVPHALCCLLVLLCTTTRRSKRGVTDAAFDWLKHCVVALHGLEQLVKLDAWVAHMGRKIQVRHSVCQLAFKAGSCVAALNLRLDAGNKVPPCGTVLRAC